MYNETDDALNGLVNLLTGQTLPPAQSIGREANQIRGASFDSIIHDEANYAVPPRNDLLDAYMQQLEDLGQRYLGQLVSESQSSQLMAQIRTSASHLMGEQLRAAGYRVEVAFTPFPNISFTVIPSAVLQEPEARIDGFIRRANLVSKPKLEGYDLWTSEWRASDDKTYLSCYYRVAAKHSKTVHTYNTSIFISTLPLTSVSFEEIVINNHKNALAKIKKLLESDVVSFKKPFWDWVRIDA
jgi:hypothetical protein